MKLVDLEQIISPVWASVSAQLREHPGASPLRTRRGTMAEWVDTREGTFWK